MKSASAGLWILLTVLVQTAPCDEAPPVARPAAVAQDAAAVTRTIGTPPETEAPQAGDALRSPAVSERKPKFRTELIRGQVVWLAEALKTAFGISTVPEVAENSLAILTKDGELIPIVEDLRGRAFRKDERLRGKETEILARRYDQQPMIQILRVYQIEDDQRYEVDYWCDVCAIIMFEKGPCACCQDDNRLRKQLVEDDDANKPAPKEKAGKETDKVAD